MTASASSPASPSQSRTDALLELIRRGGELTWHDQLRLTALLSVPAILAQVSSIVMQYIDASMVGSLGAEPAAAIGLVSTTTWLFWGLCGAVATGFSVQVAHRVGANDLTEARAVVRQGLVSVLFFSAALAAFGMAISGVLPGWLGGDASIRPDASRYFFIFALFLPALQLNYLAGGVLRCSGNIRVPSLLNVNMCVLDVLFNFFLIYPTRTAHVAGMDLTIPGAGLGVEGAALGTVLAELVTAGLMLYYLWFRSPLLRMSDTRGSFRPRRATLRRATHIGVPMGFEHLAICSAQIMTTVIVAPLGVFAIAANSFAITAESLCYMPGYGISEAATTLTGQCLGAGRRRLLLRFAHITVGSGMAIMGVMGIIMFIFAPQIIGLMTPVEEIRELGVMALRIEAFAEPMFGASIIAYGVFVGVGRTLVPSVMNLLCIWGIRLTLAAALAPTMGLRGVWLAMCIELCVRGLVFLIRLWRQKWVPPLTEKPSAL